jgi:mercuric ion transport protein
MQQEVEPSPALACVPGAIPALDRVGHFARARKLFGAAVQQRLALPNGYAFRFEPSHLPALAAFIVNERKCCPFLDFELTTTADAVWLRMTGPLGTQAFLEAELGNGSWASAAPCCTDCTTALATSGTGGTAGLADQSRLAAGTSGRLAQWTTAGGIVAALGVCAAGCLPPFALISLGAAAGWASTFEALLPFKWLFVGSAAALLGYGFYAAYWKPKRKQACADGAGCPGQQPGTGLRVGLWIGVLLVAGGIAFQYVEPMLARS